MAKIVPLRDRFADESQYCEILAAAFLHGLALSSDDEERSTLLDCVGKHKTVLGAEYDGVVEKFREGWDGH